VSSFNKIANLQDVKSMQKSDAFIKINYLLQRMIKKIKVGSMTWMFIGSFNKKMSFRLLPSNLFGEPQVYLIR
jgi:hypothetical protein